MSYRGNRNLLQKFREGEKRRCSHRTPGHRTVTANAVVVLLAARIETFLLGKPLNAARLKCPI